MDLVCAATWCHSRLQSGVHLEACMYSHVSLCVCSLVVWQRAMSEQRCPCPYRKCMRNTSLCVCAPFGHSP